MNADVKIRGKAFHLLLVLGDKVQWGYVPPLMPLLEGEDRVTAGVFEALGEGAFLIIVVPLCHCARKVLVYVL